MLKLGFIQSKIFWQDKASNLKWFEEKINQLHSTCDLIVLPEMFNTGFSMQVNTLAEKMEENTMQWMHQMATKKAAVVLGSLIIEDQKKYFNRLIWMFPDGSYQYYDKRHLFRMANEHEHFASGNSRLVIDYKGWKICPLICYDLRFPVWSRNKQVNHDFDYDLLIYVANWPERRVFAWQNLLVARAIENLCYLAGINRIGLDGNNINYSGDSVVLNFLGEKISKTERFGDCVEIVELDLNALNEYRKAFPAGLDADDFSINL